MGFFQSINDLNIGGNVVVIATKNADATYTATISIQHPKLSEGALRAVVPLNITGTPEELDRDFFVAFGEWMVKADKELVSNVEEVAASYKNAQEKTKQKAAKPLASVSVNSTGKVPSGNDAPPVNPEYKAAMDKAKLLISQKKFGQAKDVLPHKDKYPEYTAEIDEMIGKIYENRPDLLL